MPLAVFALSLSLFAIGTTEFVIVGLLPTLAGSLHVGLPAVGLLVTAYAIGIAAGGPIVTALSARMNRKHLLVALMTVFIAGNLVSAAAQNVQLLLAARVVTAVAHAVIASVGAALAISLVDKSKQARAISAVFGGLTVSLVVGVPLGTYIGQHLGWRAAFLAVAVIGALALAGDLLLLPSVPGSPGVPLRRQVARLADKRLVLALMVALLGFGGQILAYTYITPFLEHISGFSPSSISLLLLGFGAAAAVGNFIAGPLADRWPSSALLGGLALLAATLFTMTITGQTRPGAVITLLAWGAAAFGLAPIFQNFVYHSAPDIPETAGALAASSFNVGIAAGSAIGGQIVAAYSVQNVTWAGGIVVVAALAVAAYALRTAPHKAPAPAAEPELTQVP
ncbi:MFS transporter [Streptomyces sp. NPDC005708]|uniref:MFS transporter n=1 Tax=Streptomyces sp. NPDC005708 TaxID=3154564 RepID=UPI0033CDB418